MGLSPPAVVRLERTLAHWAQEIGIRHESRVSLLTVRAIVAQVKLTATPTDGIQPKTQLS